MTTTELPEPPSQYRLADATFHTPTLKEAEAITKIQDEGLRNLRITLAYHDLSHHIAQSIGYENANWCTFAVWPSRYAGTFIRGEVGPLSGLIDSMIQRFDDPDLPRESRVPEEKFNAVASVFRKTSLFRNEVRLAVQDARWRRRAKFFDKIQDHTYSGDADIGTVLALTVSSFSRATSAGNTRVFFDIASNLIPFVELLRQSSSSDDPGVRQYLANMNRRPARDGGQLELSAGLQAYNLAKHESDPTIKAQYVFAGNALVGLHEQTGLQKEIPVALDAPIDRFEQELVVRYVKGRARLRESAPAIAQDRITTWLANSTIRRFVIPASTRLVKRLWELFATQWMMRLPLPEETLDLGDDLPRLPDGTAFPPALRVKKLPFAHDMLDYLSFAYSDTLFGSGARDWVRLDERMNMIGNMFRSRQQRVSLFRPPFTPQQIRDLRRGIIPDGPLGGPIPDFSEDILVAIRSNDEPREVLAKIA